MANKVISVRCRQKVLNKKKAKLVTCDRFVAELNEYSIVVPCANCGHRHMFTRVFVKQGDKTVKWNTQILPPHESELTEPKKE